MYGAINTTFEYYTAIGTSFVESNTDILELGNKQMFTVQVDTGSPGLAVPGSGCTQYNKDLKNTGKLISLKYTHYLRCYL